MIRDLIVQTPYQPGERLPPEREIAEMLNVTAHGGSRSVNYAGN